MSLIKLTDNSKVTNFEEALDAFNLNWEVGPRPVYAAVGGEHGTVLVDGAQSIVRLDTGKPLSVVGGRYTPVQNKSFADVVNLAVKELNGKFVAGGTFKEDRTIFMQVELPGKIDLSGKDEVKKFMLFSNSHDGTTPAKIGGTNVRIVCYNTFLMAFRGVNDVVIRHTASADSKIQQAVQVVSTMHEYHKLVEIKVSELAAAKVTDAQVDEILRKSFSVEKNTPWADVHTRTLNNVTKIRDLYEGGIDLAKWRGTGWGIFNAGTEYADHAKGTRGMDDAAGSRRFESNLIGSSNTFKMNFLNNINEVLGLSAT